MRLTYAGCNLFGQLVTSSQLQIATFQPFQCHNKRNDFSDVIDIVLSHSVIAMQYARALELFGHGLSARETNKVTRIDFPCEICKLRTSDTRIIVLMQDGCVQCLDFLDISPRFNIFTFAPLDDDDKLVDFVPGPVMNVAVTQKGFLYVSQGVEWKKSILKLENKAILKKIVAGHEHLVILDTLGNVYSFGNGRKGQLGHGDQDIEEILMEAKHIDALAGIIVVDIACSGWHSMALSKDGDVYVWGWNSDGQLGLLDEDTKEAISLTAIPQYLPIAHEYNIVAIACGNRHSICVSSDGKVYAFGCNTFNQLGLDSKQSRVNVPSRVRTLSQTISKVICGPASTMIVLKC